MAKASGSVSGDKAGRETGPRWVPLVLIVGVAGVFLFPAKSCGDPGEEPPPIRQTTERIQKPRPEDPETAESGSDGFESTIWFTKQIGRLELSELGEVEVTYGRGGDRLEAQLIAGSAAAGGEMVGAHLLRVRIPEGREIDRIAFAQSGSLELIVAARRLVEGSVRNSEGQPIADAVVDASEWIDGELQTVTTDAEGRFSLETSSGTGVPIVARAEGYTTVFQRIEVTERPEPLVLRLGPEGRLRVHTRSLRELDSDRLVQLHLRPGRRGRDAIAYPFHRSADRSVELGEDGVAWIGGLPAEGQFELVCEHPSLPEGLVERFDLRSGRAEIRLRFPREREEVTVDFEFAGAPLELPAEISFVRSPVPARRGLLAPAAASPGILRGRLADSGSVTLAVPLARSRVPARGFLELGSNRVSIDWSGLAELDRVVLGPDPTVERVEVLAQGPEPTLPIRPGFWRITRDEIVRSMLLLGDTTWP